MEMTKKQTELWKVAENAMVNMGGPRIIRHPNAKIDGTKENAITTAWACAHGQMPEDDECQRLIDIINS